MLAALARMLGIIDTGPKSELQILTENLKEIEVKPHSQLAGSRIVDVNFPSSVQIMAIKREGRFFQPDGATRIEAGDQLFILANEDLDMKDLMEMIN